MKRTQLAAIVSAMHRPVDGVLPALLIPANREKITKAPLCRVSETQKPPSWATMARRIVAINPKR